MDDCEAVIYRETGKEALCGNAGALEASRTWIALRVPNRTELVTFSVHGHRRPLDPIPKAST